MLNSCCRIRGQLFSKLTLLDQLLNIIRMIIKRYEKWSYDLSCMLTREKFIPVVYNSTISKLLLHLKGIVFY